MKVKCSILICTLVSIFTFSTNLAFNASSISESSCMNTELSSDKETISGYGEQLKITFSYENKEPICSAEELANEEIIIDFSPLVNSSSNIETSFDTDIFNVDINEGGLATITFKDWDAIHNSLEGFSGTIVFTITVETDSTGDIIIEDNVGNEIIIDISPGDGVLTNTSKWADVSYAEVGDVINYSIRINTDQLDVDEFVGTDTPADGLEYVEDSFYVEEYGESGVIEPNIFEIDNKDGVLTFTNTEPFSKTYILNYQMVVTATYDSYYNNFNASYDSNGDGVSYTVDYDIEGGSDIDFTNGQIDVLKTDTSGAALSGAEFDIQNKDGVVVDHVVTGEDGHGVSDKLALGEYQVIETVAPDGYVLDDTPHKITISKDDSGNNIANLTITNEKEEEPDITNPEVKEVGNIKIIKTSEDGDKLEDAQFSIEDSNGQIVESITTNEQGIAQTSDLPLGTYYVIETKAPDGYMLDETRHEVTISTIGQVVELTIENELIDQIITSRDEESEINVEESDNIVLVDNDEEDEYNKMTLANTGSKIAISLVGLIAILILLLGLKLRNTIK